MPLPLFSWPNGKGKFCRNSQLAVYRCLCAADADWAFLPDNLYLQQQHIPWRYFLLEAGIVDRPKISCFPFKLWLA